MAYELLGLRDREYDKFSFIGSQTLVGVSSASEVFIVTGSRCVTATTPSGLTATSTPCRKVVIQPIMNDDGTAKNTKNCYIRESITNQQTGIVITPSSAGVVIYVDDANKLFVKSLVNNEGVLYSIFD